MPTYEQAKGKGFQEASGRVLMGIELDVAEDSPLVGQRGHVPIQVCVCVTDPCECRGPIVWVPLDDIWSRNATERSTRDGDTVTEFVVSQDTTLLVESVVQLTANTIDPRSRRLLVWPDSPPPINLGRDGGCGGGCGGSRGAWGGGRPIAGRPHAPGVTGFPSAPGTYFAGIDCYAHSQWAMWVDFDGYDADGYPILSGHHFYPLPASC